MLVSKSQVALAIEDLEGVAETLTASDLVAVVNRDFPRANIGAPATARPLASGTPGTKPGIAGGRDGSIQLMMELAKNKASVGAFVAAPEWSVPLRACGMYYASAKKHAVAASWSSGNKVSHGATFVADDTGAAGRIIGDWWEGEDLFIVYEVIGSTAIGASDTTLTVTYQGATQAVVTIASAGTVNTCHAYYPSVTPVTQVTIGSVTSGPINYGDELVGATSGARGRCANPDGINASGALFVHMYEQSPAFAAAETLSVVGGSASAPTNATPNQTQRQIPSLSLQTLNDGHRTKLKGTRGTWSLALINKEQGLFTFDLQGVPAAQPDEIAMLSFVRNSANPPKVIGGSLLVDNEFAPRFANVGYAGNNAVALREDPGDSTASGHFAAEIADYAHTMTMDPEAVQAAIHDWWGKQWDKSFSRVKHVIGSGTGNTFMIRQSYLQVEELTHGERNQHLTNQHSLNATSGDELEHPGGTLILHY